MDKAAIICWHSFKTSWTYIARIEAHKLELQPTAFRLHHFLKNIVELVRGRAEQKELAFRFEVVGELPDGVLADETRLRQVLLNLLGNAVKFTSQGEITLRVTHVPQETAVLPQPSLPPDEFAIPPADQLEQLYRLALSGNLLAIQAASTQTERQNGRFAPFFIHLARLAENFEEEAIIAYLEKQLA